MRATFALPWACSGPRNSRRGCVLLNDANDVQAVRLVRVALARRHAPLARGHALYRRGFASWQVLAQQESAAHIGRGGCLAGGR